MSINEIQDEIIEEFSGFDDWMDKYQLLIDLGNEQEPLDEQYKVESNLIDGCQSRVWLQADYHDGIIDFTAESDALIVKGIVALLIRVLSGHTPQEILDAEALLHRPDRTERTPLTYPLQRSAGNGEADADVRPCLQGERRDLVILVGIELPQIILPEVAPTIIRGNTGR